MVQIIDALSACVRHVGTFEETPDLVAIRSLPTCILKVLRETFQHCKVSLFSSTVVQTHSAKVRLCVYFMFLLACEWQSDSPYDYITILFPRCRYNYDTVILHNRYIAPHFLYHASQYLCNLKDKLTNVTYQIN